jgi:solute carrier family 25 (mitochondrial phosphate transporter), member 3
MAATAPPSSTGSTKLDAIKATAAAADPTKPQGLALYGRFAFAGAVCCSITHGGLTPVDVYVRPVFDGFQWLEALFARPECAS